MRVSWGGLLIILAIAIPFLVQARTVLHFLGIDITVEQWLIGSLLVLMAILLWAFLPQNSVTDPQEPHDQS